MVVDFITSKGSWAFIKGDWEDVQNFESDYPDLRYKKFKVIDEVKDLTEEDWSKVVDNTIKCNMCEWEGSEEELKTFTDLSDNNISHDISYFTGCPNCTTDSYLMNTAKESGESLMESLEVYLENPVSYPENPEDQGWIDAWQHCGERSGSWLLIQYN